MDDYIFQETIMRDYAFKQLRGLLYRNPTANELESHVYKMKVISLQKHKEKLGIKYSELEVIEENTIAEPELLKQQSPEPELLKQQSPEPELLKQQSPEPELLKQH